MATVYVFRSGNQVLLSKAKEPPEGAPKPKASDGKGGRLPWKFDKQFDDTERDSAKRIGLTDALKAELAANGFALV